MEKLCVKCVCCRSSVWRQCWLSPNTLQMFGETSDKINPNYTVLLLSICLFFQILKQQHVFPVSVHQTSLFHLWHSSDFLPLGTTLIFPFSPFTFLLISTCDPIKAFFFCRQKWAFHWNERSVKRLSVTCVK